MAGNVATGESFLRLAQWGVDSIRVGIGGGSICSTRINTGFGVPNLSAIFDCVSTWQAQVVAKKLPLVKPSLIIDGGIKTAGDIVKALAAGADFVMCGSLLAGTDETPGELVDIMGHPHKSYRGMASREAQTDFKGSSSSPEGIATHIPWKGSVDSILKDLAGNIKSGFSYAGARNIKELRLRAQFIKQTQAGQHESFTHILR
jgi:IMP dehydrogenase